MIVLPFELFVIKFYFRRGIFKVVATAARYENMVYLCSND